jgi:hypothetical protein
MSLRKELPSHHCRLQTGRCDGVRLASQHCGLGPVVLSPDDSECEAVSRGDWLGLTPNLSTRALWPSLETSGDVGDGLRK